MCGIIGNFSFQQETALSEELFRQLNQTQEHRGPDGGDIYVKGNIFLGTRRLAVIDIDTGDQPMISADGRHVIVFNGEIYNFKDLRKELIGQGHVFRTESDTEVLLHLYRQQGPAGLSRLNGMFAFAIWDDQTKELFIARDRMGVKPLYYAMNEQRLFFSSELTPIYCSGLFSLTWDHETISNYLAYWYVCEPKTIFQEIKQLPPGHYAVVSSGRMQISPWWKIPAEKETTISFSHACESLDGLLEDAVKLRMHADVPVGVFLSGGIDSGLIASYARAYAPGRLKTFSIGFKEKTYNELPQAKCTADALDVDFNAVHMDALSVDDIEKVIAAFDEPLGNASFFPTYFLAGAARGSLKVVLSGDGGDELFGGYPTYQASYYLKAWRHMPGVLKDLIRRGIDKIPVDHGRISLDYRLKQLMKGIDLAYPKSHYTWREVMAAGMQAQAFRPEIWGKICPYDPGSIIEDYFTQASRMGIQNQAMYADLNTYLLNDHLRKMDRMTMAHGLEARLPFMDYRIVEFAMSLPQEHKVSLLKTKRILKQIAQRRLPAMVVRAPKKGLTPPIAHWLTQDLKDYFEGALQGGIVEELFDPQVVRDLWVEHQEKRRDHSRILWGLIVLNIWEKSLKAKRSYAQDRV